MLMKISIGLSSLEKSISNRIMFATIHFVHMLDERLLLSPRDVLVPSGFTKLGFLLNRFERLFSPKRRRSPPGGGEDSVKRITSG